LKQEAKSLPSAVEAGMKPQDLRASAQTEPQLWRVRALVVLSEAKPQLWRVQVEAEP
jgi:hypothetical protein